MKKLLFITIISWSFALYSQPEPANHETFDLNNNQIEYTYVSSTTATSSIKNTEYSQSGRYVFIMYVVKKYSNDKVYTFITPVFYSSESERTLQSDFKTWFRANYSGYDERFDPIVDWSYNDPKSESAALRKRDKIIGKKDASSLVKVNFTGY